jgi:hypothetical protein
LVVIGRMMVIKHPVESKSRKRSRQTRSLYILLLQTHPLILESFGLDLPYGMSLEGSLLGQSEQSPAGMGDETADGKETDMEPKSKLTFSVPFAEVVRRVQANPGDIHILETVEPLQVYLGSFVSNSDRVPSLQCCVTIEYCLMQLCGLVLF